MVNCIMDHYACECKMEAREKELLEIKTALREAILQTSRVKRVLVDYDSAGSTYDIDWLETVKKWAALADLDLSQHDPMG